MTPLTVIVPFYNETAFLHAALTSIKAQRIEAAIGHPVKLADFDTARQGAGMWPAFCALAGLDLDGRTDLPAVSAPHYKSHSRETTNFLRLVNMLQPDTQIRQSALRGYFSTAPDGYPAKSALPPAARLALLDQWQDQSSEFAAARGYGPDVEAWRLDLTQEDWTAPTGVSHDQITALLAATASALPQMPPLEADHASRAEPNANVRSKFRIHPRPWVYNTYDWVTQRLPFSRR